MRLQLAEPVAMMFTIILIYYIKDHFDKKKEKKNENK